MTITFNWQRGLENVRARFQRFEIAIDTSDSWVVQGEGRLATEEDIRGVLADVQWLRIRGANHFLSSDTDSGVTNYYPDEVELIPPGS